VSGGWGAHASAMGASLGGGDEPERPEPSAKPGGPVTLHVYDMNREKGVRFVNHVFQRVGTGAFHAGVEVLGLEFSFSTSGVFHCLPSQNPLHTYREAVALGVTPLTAPEVREVVIKLRDEWAGEQYDILTRNCCHFSAEFSQELGVDPVPGWVTHLAGAGAAALEGLEARVLEVGASAAALEAFSVQEVDLDAELVKAQAWCSRLAASAAGPAERLAEAAQRPLETPAIQAFEECCRTSHCTAAEACWQPHGLASAPLAEDEAPAEAVELRAGCSSETYAPADRAPQRRLAPP